MPAAGHSTASEGDSPRVDDTGLWTPIRLRLTFHWLSDLRLRVLQSGQCSDLRLHDVSH